MLPVGGQGQDEDNIHRDIQQYGIDPDAYRGFGVLHGVECGNKDLRRAEDHKPRCIKDQCAGAEQGGLRVKIAVPFKNGAQNLRGQHQQTQRRGDHDECELPKGIGYGSAHGFMIIHGRMGGKGRQQNGAKGRGDDAEREIDHTLAVEQRGRRPFADPHGQQTVDQYIKLRHCHAERGRPHQQQHAPYARIVPLAGKFERTAEAPERRKLDKELRGSGQDDRPGQYQCPAVGLCSDQGEDRQHEYNQDQVQQAGRKGRGGEMPEGVQYGHGEGGAADQDDIGKHDARQLEGDEPFFRDPGNTQSDGKEQHPQNTDRGQQCDGHGEHFGPHIPRRFVAFLGAGLDEDRNKGGGKSAFAEKAAEEVGDGEGHKEGRGQHGGAEVIGDHDIAQHTQGATEQRKAANHAG